MKKILLLLLLYLVFENTFSQNIFQENFEKGILNDSWKITSGKWSVANLEKKGIKPPPGDNNFALASAGNAEIIIDIPIENTDPETPQQLSFTYWVHSKESTGLATIVFLNAGRETISSIQFETLQPKDNWELFNQQFKAPIGTAVIRLKLGEISAAGRNTVYFKNMLLRCPKCRER
jgi:hypothetical protein